MVLDNNLCSAYIHWVPNIAKKAAFTLTQVDEDPSGKTINITEDNSRHPSYIKRSLNIKVRDTNAISLSDPISDGMLGEVQWSKLPNVRSVREAAILLHDPEAFITFKSVSRVLFEWSFQFEGLDFRISRDCISSVLFGPCSMMCAAISDKTHRQDPAVDVASISLNPLGLSTKTMSLTLFDHNLSRIGICDIKGFEVSLLLCLLFLVEIWREDGDLVITQRESERLAKFRDPELEIARRAKLGVDAPAHHRKSSGDSGHATSRVKRFLAKVNAV